MRGLLFLGDSQPSFQRTCYVPDAAYSLSKAIESVGNIDYTLKKISVKQLGLCCSLLSCECRGFIPGAPLGIRLTVVQSRTSDTLKEPCIAVVDDHAMCSRVRQYRPTTYCCGHTHSLLGGAAPLADSRPKYETGNA